MDRATWTVQSMDRTMWPYNRPYVVLDAQGQHNKQRVMGLRCAWTVQRKPYNVDRTKWSVQLQSGPYMEECTLRTEIKP